MQAFHVYIQVVLVVHLKRDYLGIHWNRIEHIHSIQQAVEMGGEFQNLLVPIECMVGNRVEDIACAVDHYLHCPDGATVNIPLLESIYIVTILFTFKLGLCV